MIEDVLLAMGRQGMIRALVHVRLLALCLLVTSLVGCNNVPQKSIRRDSDAKDLPIEMAVQIAVSKAREAGLLQGREYQLNAGFGAKCWVVTIEYLPRTFDSELVILVYSAEHVEGPWDRIGKGLGTGNR